MTSLFRQRLLQLVGSHAALTRRPNRVAGDWDNGVFDRFEHPVITSRHTPLFWRYDLNEATNPYLMERLGVNVTFNPGALVLEDKVMLCVRVEGLDRKSFFAICESKTGLDNFRFWPEPILLEETDIPDTNVYDMRLVLHEDGWIYGTFCAERKDPDSRPGDHSSAVAQCGIVRTKDLKTWERLPDLKTRSAQQRNVVLHPEFVHGKYAFYTRPQDGFVDAGSGGGIGFALSTSIESAETGEERIIDHRIYHTIKEVKNGQGPPPIRTRKGWLHIAHGVRNTAAGLRYVLYSFMTDLDDPTKVVAAPAGHLIAPEGDERMGDVSNVVFCNGMVTKSDGTLLIYYASSDTRCHVARTTVDKLVDYCLNTPVDGLRSRTSVQTRLGLIRRNMSLQGAQDDPLLREALDLCD